MNVIGTCSLCGGQVVTPELWGGVVPPTPACTRCGAVAARSGPVIPMRRVDGPGSAWSSGSIPTKQVRYHSQETRVRDGVHMPHFLETTGIKS